MSIGEAFQTEQAYRKSHLRENPRFQHMSSPHVCVPVCVLYVQFTFDGQKGKHSSKMTFSDLKLNVLNKPALK